MCTPVVAQPKSAPVNALARTIALMSQEAPAAGRHKRADPSAVSSARSAAALRMARPRRRRRPGAPVQAEPVFGRESGYRPATSPRTRPEPSSVRLSRPAGIAPERSPGDGQYRSRPSPRAPPGTTVSSAGRAGRPRRGGGPRARPARQAWARLAEAAQPAQPAGLSSGARSPRRAKHVKLDGTKRPELAGGLEDVQEAGGRGRSRPVPAEAR